MPPTGPNDKAQQPLGSGFPASNLYPNSNIWNASISRDRPAAVSNQESEHSPTAAGSSALNANSEPVWSGRPWSNGHPARSVNNSPNRVHEATLANSASFLEHSQAHGALGLQRSSFDADAYPTQNRATHDAPFDTIGAFASRDQNLPAMRQHQGSSSFAGTYQPHGHSNSVHSQRGLPSHAASVATAHQRQFNTRLDEDISAQFSQRMSLDEYPATSSFNPASQPFQINPDSSWMADGSRLPARLDYPPAEAIGSHVSAIRRGSLDRITPSPTYNGLDSNNSPRLSQAVNSGIWAARPSSRDPRTADSDRRSQAQHQHFQLAYPQNLYNQYGYGMMPPQYAPNFVDHYAQPNYAQQHFRQSLIQNYGLPPVPATYPHNNGSPSLRSSRDQDPSKAVRSYLLEEFRQSNKSNRRYEIKDIYDHVVEFSGDQHGSRFIQSKLETANSDEKEQVFREIEQNAVQLMKDVFGNYVVQKFFEHGNQVQKKILAEKMRGKVVDLSLQVYACRVVQKALEHILVEQQAELAQELAPEILRVIRDANGNHVVQKVIELVPRPYIGFINEALRGQVTGLSSHNFGCRIIQRVLENGTEADKLAVMTELHASAQILFTDQFGNYVTQHVIRNGKPEDRKKLIQLVMSQLHTFSKHKFASNVVEKCIQFGTAEQRTAIRLQLTTPGSDGTNPLPVMIRDQYGNYVIQKLLAYLSGTEKDNLVELVKPQFYALKKNGNMRQLQSLEELLGLGGREQGDHTDTGGRDQDDHTDTGGRDQGDHHDTLTPALTNETGSPRTSSPPSTHVSAVSLAAADAPNKASIAAPGAVQVHDEEA
ncbi:Armadillo-type fold domain containing protein [Cordyceps fumosorosea ARSEF 2679]|uniref:Armadillo-type fold domain containing protein n=1 Tax=Cordyceps fumosorosea (strain ARSEF 2679) TaxID=1081104 RepID=A0A168ELI4_CORFA|nr:Armadillo-type fold domain containing protein [Cordyceps fumosorosea ARSEF 2679]OAA73953.1 Armadillo-type fold domain containing protein [Cordyceps fumosorosea ARSEF 2679]